MAFILSFQETVTEIARKWTKVLKTGGIEVNFMGVDLVTVMFTLQRGLDNLEVGSFLQVLYLQFQFL